MSLLALPGILTVLLALTLTLIVFVRRPPERLWPSLFFVLLAVSIWSTGELLAEFADVGDRLHWFFVQFLYTGVLMLGPAWWAFALAFASYVRVDFRWDVPLVRRFPIGLAVLYWIGLVTNPLHGQFITANTEERNDYHFIWYCQTFTVYTLFILSSLVFLSLLRRSKSSVKTQVAIMITGSMMPFIANVLFVSRVLPSDYDPTVGAMTISAGLYFWGIYHTRLFALSPFTLQQLINNDEDLCLILDTNQSVLFFNEKALDFFGRDSLYPYCDGAELLRTRLRIPEGDGDFAIPSLTDDNRDLTIKHQVFVDDTHESDGKWLHLSTINVKSRRGRVLGIGVRIRDLTELVEKTIMVDNQVATLEAILESSDQGILVMDDSPSIIFANSRFQELWSISDEIANNGYGDESMVIVLDQVIDPEGFLERINSLLGDRLLESRELIHLKNGRVIERNSRPITIGEETHSRCWMFRDVTEELRAEEEKIQSDKRLRESQRLESLGIMAGGIAHDFNNILFGVMGNAELLLNRRGPDSKDTKEIQAILEASARAAELVNQMLSYAGQSEFRIEPIHLSELIDTTASLLGTVISKSVSLELELDSSLLVHGDAVQLRQVVMNLITNASESYEGSGGAVALLMERQVVSSDDSIEFYGTEGLEGGTYAVITITDHGVGMGEETLRKLFDPFYTTKFDGRGLGLAAVLGIVRSHRGALTVASTEGEGTSISVYLPIYLGTIPEVSANRRESVSE